MSNNKDFVQFGADVIKLQQCLNPEVALIILRLLEEKGADMTSTILSELARTNAKIEASNAKIEALVKANGAEIQAMKESVNGKIDGINGKIDGVKYFNIFAVAGAIAAFVAAISSFISLFK